MNRAMNRARILKIAIPLMLAAVPVIYVALRAADARTALDRSLWDAGFYPLKPPSTLVGPGSIYHVSRDGKFYRTICKVDAAVFVIDCLPNMDAKLVTERCIPLVNQLRAARPETPIVLVEDRRNTNSWIHPDRAAHHTANHAALKAAFAALQAEGIKRLHYIEGDALLGDDGDGATDGSHPNDLGFVRQADVMEPVLRKALAS